jgi:stearoyl-CoA desaturase (delta-9 desaturase)
MARLERQITVVAVVLPFIGFLVALWLLWGGAVTGLDLAILAVMYALVGFGVTIGFHRLFTHRSFQAKPWLRGTLAILGSMSVQGAVIHWVADHRKHHAFTDVDGDPHSPKMLGWKRVQLDNVGLYRREARNDVTMARYAKDIPRDRWDSALFDKAWLGLTLGISVLLASSLICRCERLVAEPGDIENAESRFVCRVIDAGFKRDQV